jgi:replicative DNA helicase Mcm
MIEINEWDEFLRRYYEKKIYEVAEKGKKSLEIEYNDIFKFSPDLAERLIDEPEIVIKELEEALRRYILPHDVKLDKVRVRIIGLGNERRKLIRDIRSEDIGKFLSVEGLVRKVTEVRPKLVEAVFLCEKCGTVINVPQNGSKLATPQKCVNELCTGNRFTLLPEESKFVDSQRIRIQESPEDLKGGEQPQMLDILLEDDLSGIVAPGDKIIVNGILRAYPREGQRAKSNVFDIYLEGNSIEIQEQEFEDLEITKEDYEKIMELAKDPDICEKIINSIAPSIYGYREIKEAIALQLFSGVPKLLPDGSRIRGDIHILLVGDPGIAKSQLLRYVVQLAPRGIYTSGKSSTSAGLTATAVKDEFGEGRWTLEAGALVLADKGIAAVDEIDKMTSDDRSALHEAMEQQTISVAKAGITATLKTRCSLLAAANPKSGRFDPHEMIATQINMPPTLLSRFDLIFPMMDSPSKDLDEKIAEHILRVHYAGELDAIKRNFVASRIRERDIEEAMKVIQPPIEPELLRKYIAYARRTIFPVLSEEARKRLEEYYVGLRRQAESGDAPIPITARQLEALIRLSEASARMRMSEIVEIEDVERVIRLMEGCLKKVGVDPETGRMDIDTITTGTTKSQRDRIKMIIDIIKELEGDEGARESEVLERAEELGIPRHRTSEIITMLIRNGELTTPRYGILKLVSRY